MSQSMFMKRLGFKIVNCQKLQFNLQFWFSRHVVFQNQFLHSSSVSGCSISLNEFPEIELTIQCKKKMMKLKLEFEKMRLSNEFAMPKEVNESDWLELMKLNLAWQRKEYYRYMKKRELSNDKDNVKKINMDQKFNLQQEANQCDNYINKSNNSSILPLVSHEAITHFYNNNLIYAARFGQKLVIDLGYDQYMWGPQWNTLVMDIVCSYNTNKKQKEPFHLFLCNCKSHQIYKRLQRSEIMTPKTPLIEITEKSYIDIFPKEQLVYLTPDSDEELVYSHDDIYVIGGLIERDREKPRSFRKAKSEGLRTARFPLKKDQTVEIISVNGTVEIISIYETVKLLLTLQKFGNWKLALENYVYL